MARRSGAPPMRSLPDILTQPVSASDSGIRSRQKMRPLPSMGMAGPLRRKDFLAAQKAEQLGSERGQKIVNPLLPESSRQPGHLAPSSPAEALAGVREFSKYLEAQAIKSVLSADLSDPRSALTLSGQTKAAIRSADAIRSAIRKFR